MRLATAVAAALMLALAAASADARPAPATPELIENAVARGKIAPSRGHLLLAYAIAAPDRLPPAYRSSTPWDGTTELLQLSRALKRMPPGPTAREIEALVEPAASGATCSSSSSSLPSSTSTAHFYVEYGTIAAASDLDVADYTASLETAWATEVDSFGWAAPPVAPTPAPGSRYHVRIDALSPGLYGFVSPAGTHAGVVGNNPNTAWSDGDAYASCMVLNRDYSGFAPSSPQQALDSTTAHEFNHSLQFGYGALSGANAPDDVFAEGGATWVEDEVFDNANDNYLYLWPVFADGMGDYDNSPYPYWITFRGLTERFGTGVAGGGEDVMQRFWELTSKNEAGNLGALDSALVAEGTTLADAFHAYAIAVKFKKPCGGAHVLPYCFEEAAAYPSNTVAAANSATIASVGGSASGIRLEDHYAIKWIGLPTTGGPYSVTLANVSSAGGPGRLRGTVVCDTGSALTRHPLPSVVADGGSATVTPVDPAGCSSVVLAVTNQTKTADNPGTSPTRRFNVQTASAASPYPLTVAKSGDGSGTVTSAPAGIDCGGTCAADFAPGTSVTLTAAATGGSSFTGWSGACSGTGACVVSMTQARSVTATFQADRALIVTKSGDGSGTVTSAPAGISCGATCQADFAHGTSVTLTPVAAAGSAFTGWSGACTGTGACVVSMTQARGVTATFEAQTPTLSVTKSGDGSGTVTSTPEGIDCGSTCSAEFAYETVVTLTSTPAAGSTFTGWSGACSGTGTCQVTTTEARAVTATFQPLRSLSVTKPGDGSGTVTSDPAGIDCGTTCSAQFTHGTSVTLTVAASPGSTFTGWGGACSGTGACVVSMTQARNVTATFEGPRSLSVTKSGDGTGAVSSSPAGIDCGSACSAEFGYETVVTLTAVAAPGSAFTGWSGACTGTGACVLSMTEARNVTATFAAAVSAPPPSEPAPEPDPEPEPDPAPTVFDPAPSEPTAPGRDPAPSPLTPILDTVPPQISFLSGKRIRATKTGRITLRLGCAASETPGCEGRVRLYLLRRTPRRVGRKSFEIAPGSNGRVVIRLARTARRQLARTGRIRVRAIVRAVDAAGNVTELRRTLTVRPAR